MLLRHRGMLTLVTLVVLAGVTVGGALWLHHSHVDPATASRDQLLRYLVLADLGAQPKNAQQAWVDRLQLELTQDFAIGGQAQTLSASYRERLLRNIATLQSVWFQSRTAEYARLPTEHREAFMLEQLALVGSLARVSNLVESTPTPPAEATGKLIERIEEWVRQAEGAQRDEMIAAVKDGTLCWLSTTDLALQPWEMKRALAVRLARELDHGAPPRVAGLVTDSVRREQLARNLNQLVQAYIYSRAEEYAALPADERLTFLDDQLEVVERWGISNLLATEDSTARSSVSVALALAQRSQQWIDDAPVEQQPQVRGFVTAAQQRIVWKQLPTWMRR